LSALPVIVSYVFFPAWTYGLRNLDLPEYRNIIDLAWVFVILLSLAKLLVRPRLRAASFDAFCIAGAAFLLLALAVLRFGPALFSDGLMPAPYLMEIKPLLYLACALLSAAAFGLPADRQLLWGGLILASFILCESIVDFVQYGRFVRPMGSGEVNYDAFLLLISLIVALSGQKAAKIRAAIIFLGIAVCLSRTAVLATAVSVFLLPKVSLLFRSGVAFGCCALFFVYFFVRGVDIQGLESIDRWWMWSSAFTLLTEHPVQALIGFPPGEALPVKAPAFLSALWEAQGKAWNAQGVFPFNYHAFWLRMAITWGILATALLPLLLGFLTLRRQSPRLPALLAAGALMGTTMGLVYPGNTAIIFLMVIYAALLQRPASSCRHLRAPQPARTSPA
jgi:hypothetical protein